MCTSRLDGKGQHRHFSSPSVGFRKTKNKTKKIFSEHDSGLKIFAFGHLFVFAFFNASTQNYISFVACFGIRVRWNMTFGSVAGAHEADKKKHEEGQTGFSLIREFVCHQRLC
jgi:hypothetical protein